MALRKLAKYKDTLVLPMVTLEQQRLFDDLKAICDERNAQFKQERITSTGFKIRHGLDNGRRFYWAIRDMQIVKKYIWIHSTTTIQ